MTNIKSFFNKSNVGKWLEHALFVAGGAAVVDLAANATQVSSDDTTLLIVGALLTAATRFFNKKLGNSPNPEPTE